MKLCTYRHNNHQHLGVVNTESALVYAARDVVPDAPDDMIQWITKYGTNPPKPRFSDAPAAALSEIELEAPIKLPPRNILCVGKNYQQHAREFASSGYDKTSADAIPEAPIVFTKAPSCVIGPGETILHPSVLTQKLDYEAELGVVIGRSGRAISRHDAYDHVFGYVILNDITARDLQSLHRQWFIGKSMDTFCPMGPWIVTHDAIDPEDLSIKCWVNDELRQDAHTSELIFDIPTLIETISAGLTLMPGDIIATGTPKGVGIGFDPPRFLWPGDTIRIEISAIGSLYNQVGKDS